MTTDVTKMSAAELRETLRQKDWKEFCEARINRQAGRIASLTKKIDAKQVALAEAKTMKAEAEAGLAQGPPADWVGVLKPKAGGVSVEVPAGELKAKGN